MVALTLSYLNCKEDDFSEHPFAKSKLFLIENSSTKQEPELNRTETHMGFTATHSDIFILLNPQESLCALKGVDRKEIGP